MFSVPSWSVGGRGLVVLLSLAFVKGEYCLAPWPRRNKSFSQVGESSVMSCLVTVSRQGVVVFGR